MTVPERGHFIPLTRGEVRDRLLQDARLTETDRSKLAAICEMMQSIWHYRMHASLEELKSTYAPIDPDLGDAVDLTDAATFLDLFDRTLRTGNWERITDQEIDDALNGEDVFPISLRVRFDEFVESRLYKLGESRSQRTLSRLWGRIRRTVELETFDRVIQVLQFQPRDWFVEQRRLGKWPGVGASGIHIRLFKSVPKLDLEVIFPNTSPCMRNIDRIKVIAPLVGGLVAVGLKFGPLLFGDDPGRTSGALVGGIASAVGTYALKSYLSYRKTKERYLQQVAQDLYFKGLANDEAVLTAVVDLAEEQEVKEALLAYVHLRLAPESGASAERLDETIEAWLASLGVEVDFEVDDALAKLHDLGLVRSGVDGEMIEAVEPDEALRLMDEYWDGIFTFAND